MSSKKTIRADLQGLITGVICTTNAYCTIMATATAHLFVELHEKFTDITIANVAYVATGPDGEVLKGATNGQGRLSHRRVRVGAYKIELPDFGYEVLVQTTKDTGYARVVTMSPSKEGKGNV